MRSCQDWSCVCYTRDGERRAVPQNDETSQKCGVYKSDCCWAEIVINVGSIFPDCPNHPKFTTMWKPVVDGKISRVTGKKSESDPVVSRNSILHVTGSFCISSGGVSVVITQHSAQPFASLNGPHLFTDSSNWNDEPVVKSLVISLEVIMKNEMVNRQT